MDTDEAAVKGKRKADTRRYARFSILEYAMIFPKGGYEPQRSVIVDVGLGGLQVLAKKQFGVGDLCDLTIGRSDGSKINVPGEVRFSNKLENSGLFATGMRFAPETHEQRSDLVDYVHGVFQRQAELLTS